MLNSDFADARKVTNSEVTYRGKVWEIARDQFELAESMLTRDYLKHPGAVAVVALNDAGEVLFISQYRHPVAHSMIEIPAGLLDSLDEDPLAAAKRELAEEAGYMAANWQVLVDFCTSPGSSSEAVRVFLATGLSPALENSYLRTAEESEIEIWFEPLETAIAKIFSGGIQSPTAVVGVLAAQTHLRNDVALRGSIAGWPMREELIVQNRLFKF
jgi:ADP-ribose pyrophosphatase